MPKANELAGTAAAALTALTRYTYCTLSDSAESRNCVTFGPVTPTVVKGPAVLVARSILKLCSLFELSVHETLTLALEAATASTAVGAAGATNSIQLAPERITVPPFEAVQSTPSVW